MKVYVLEADSYRGCIEHVKGYKHPRISILYANYLFVTVVETESIWEVFYKRIPVYKQKTFCVYTEK